MTEQRKRFADKYFETLSGTQSAIYAGYSEKTATVQASQLLAEPEISEYLQNLRNKEAERNGVSREKWLNELKKVGFSDVRELYNSDGGLHNIKQIDDDTAGAISSIKSKEVYDNEGKKVGDIIEVKTHDKLRALDTIGKHLGYFEKDNSQKQPDAKQNNIHVTIVPPKEDDE